jgi:hypothetical protein
MGVPRLSPSFSLAVDHKPGIVRREEQVAADDA